MRVTALAFALALLAANTAAAGCWGSSAQVADSGDATITTAEAPIQTPVPAETDSES